jgi:hypothetical protein
VSKIFRTNSIIYLLLVLADDAAGPLGGFPLFSFEPDTDWRVKPPIKKENHDKSKLFIFFPKLHTYKLLVLLIYKYTTGTVGHRWRNHFFLSAC